MMDLSPLSRRYVAPSVRNLRRTALPLAQLTHSRTLILTPRKRSTTPRRRTGSQNIEPDLKRQAELRVIDKKLDDLRQLTKELRLDLAIRDEEKVKQEIANLDEPIDPESEDIDILYRELTGKDESGQPLLLSESSVENGALLFNNPARGTVIPSAVLERIGDSVRNIVVKNNQNWNALIHDLHKSPSGLKDLSRTDVYAFLNQISVGGLNEENLSKVHEMLVDANIEYGTTTYDFMMKQYAELNHPVVVQSLFDSAVQSGIKPTKYMFGHLIKVYCKSQNLDRVNLTLNKMFSNGLEPSKKVYTNVLQLCVTMKDEHQADEIFQMMKFRSLQSKPDVEAYNTMIQLTAKTGNIHRAIDLYQEMLDSKLEPTVFTFNCLAQVCSKNSGFYRRGWEFIHQIHEGNLEPNVNTFEIMLRLAAKDGDLELARALYVKIFEMRPDIPTAGADALNYLMMAYRDFKPDQKPQITLYREGFIIRRNILNMVDFLGLHQTMVADPQLQKIKETYPPMLPVRALQRPDHIIAESNAIWAFNINADPSVFSLATLTPYLKISVENGDKDEFLKLYDQFTFPNGEIGKNEMVLEESDDPKIETGNDELNDGNITGPPVLNHVKQLNYKLERESSLYVMLLVAGRRFRDEKMCQRAWVERGRYRRTSSYQSLDHWKKKELDFYFSREMVNALMELNLLTDAVGVVLSSSQFAWSFYYLKPLYVALLDIGDKANAQAISDFCNKSEKNHRSVGSRSR